MLTSSGRAKLRAMATSISPIFQIGKGGVSENQLKDIVAALEARELIKITVLRNADTTAKDIIDDLAKRTSAEAVTAIGSKIVLYKRSTREDYNHIEF